MEFGAPALPSASKLADDVQTIMKGQSLIESVRRDGKFVPRRTPEDPLRQNVKV